MVPQDFYQYFPYEKDSPSSMVTLDSPKIYKPKDSLVSVLTENKNLCMFYEIEIPMFLKYENIALLWNLWELMITGTPILIITNNPEESSFIIGIALSLIFPLKYDGDFRPYETLYDQDVKEYAEIFKKGDQKPAIILGACNPYFNNVFL